MRDFTIIRYLELISEFKKAKYNFETFEEYLTKERHDKKAIILRHDVDKRPKKSMEIAWAEQKCGIRGNYYFRVTQNGYPEEIIKAVAGQGHEIGYHYEDLNSTGGNIKKTLISFENNLEALRKLASIKTICMHGTPMSKYDNRDIWKERSYREYGIIGEPYFDVDFSKVMYLTDTGRRWDGDSVSVRDKVRGDRLGVIGEDKGKHVNKWPRFHSTQDIIDALRNGEMPDQIMLTIHPQRWTNAWGPWVWELVSQKVKNVIKYFVVKYRGKKVRGDG